MTKASTAKSTINPAEAAHFGALAGDWWDPDGSSAMLHKLNPVRLGYIREQIDLHFNVDSTSLKPLMGKRVLDVGCGAGLLCEPLARLGAEVTGLDAAPENIAAATAHAEAQGLQISYRNHDIQRFSDDGFDLVTSLEVIEHVDDPEAFLAGLSRAMADDGLMILSTPNRTSKSKLLLVELAELAGQIPRGTHDHEKFCTPPELEKLLAVEGLTVIDTTGINFNPLQGFELSDDLSLNYLMTIIRS